jgi:hypothetical protein
VGKYFSAADLFSPFIRLEPNQEAAEPGGRIRPSYHYYESDSAGIGADTRNIHLVPPGDSQVLAYDRKALKTNIIPLS